MGMLCGGGYYPRASWDRGRIAVTPRKKTLSGACPGRHWGGYRPSSSHRPMAFQDCGATRVVAVGGRVVGTDVVDGGAGGSRI
jgi:hypothetical protein